MCSFMFFFVSFHNIYFLICHFIFVSLCIIVCHEKIMDHKTSLKCLVVNNKSLFRYLTYWLFWYVCVYFKKYITLKRKFKIRVSVLMMSSENFQTIKLKWKMNYFRVLTRDLTYGCRTIILFLHQLFHFLLITLKIIEKIRLRFKEI